MMTKHEIEILLVEDNESDAKMTIRALKKKGFCNNVLHLKDGAEALDFVFATGKFEDQNPDHQPKIILLNLKMSKVSGIEVLKTLKSDERTKDIPVIILTSSQEDPAVKVCYELGVKSYIVKPVDFENFTNAISELGVYWLLLNQPPL